MSKNKKPPRNKNNSNAEGTLPTREELRAFIEKSEGPVNKREIARAFGIKGQDRTTLRKLLRDMEQGGGVEQTRAKTYAPRDALPETATLEITGPDGDGELRARVADGENRTGPEPIIYVIDKNRALAAGDRILARLKRISKHEYEARILKAGEEGAERVVGVFKSHKGGGWVTPTDRKNRNEYFIPPEFCEDVDNGELVIAERVRPTGKWPKSKNPSRIAERLGKKDDPRLISLISIHSHGIPVDFPRAVMEETKGMIVPPAEKGRVDIRDIPLVTIDGEDARDFDDAVFAEPDTDPKNPGGWHLVVAIADVSYYVRAHTALDTDARKRGNSTYFPDRVVPMLPEKLSNDLCSLRPSVNRACLGVHMWIDKDAKLVGHKFFRGLMNSAARLTYEQVEAAHLGAPDDTTGPLMDRVIKPLYKAYGALKHAREKRGALELDLPERKAVIDEKGNVTAIIPRKRLESHQLIEEFMILANVAAAEALEAKHTPCVYRIHPPPAPEKLEATRDFLKQMGYSLPRSDNLQPRNINHILRATLDKPDKDLVHTVLLRTQSQAVYSPDNIGHFGLALTRYAHFTSPIRRYADLLVHRALVKAYNLGEGGLLPAEAEELADTSEHISATERRSMLAERDAGDRFTAQYISANIGKDFGGKISGVTRFGLFVTLDDSGADGLVPIRSLPQDFYIHDEKRHALVGRRTGRTFRLADPVAVRLVEADPMRGSTVFELLESVSPGDPPVVSGRRDHRDRKRSEGKRGGDGRKDGGKNRRGKGRGRGKR